MAKKNPGTDWLDRVVDYLYWRAQSEDVGSQSEYEDFTLALAIIGLCRQNHPNPYEMAFHTAFGTFREKFLKARRDREWMAAKALNATLESAEPVRRPTENRGAVYQMPAKEKPAVKEPMRAVPRKAAEGQ